MKLLNQITIPIMFNDRVLADWLNDHFVLAYDLHHQGMRVAVLDASGCRVSYSNENVLLYTSTFPNELHSHIVNKKQTIYPVVEKTRKLMFFGEDGEMQSTSAIHSTIFALYPLQDGSFIAHECDGTMECFATDGKLLWRRHDDNMKYRLKNIFAIRELAVGVFMDIDDQLHPLIRCFNSAGEIVHEQKISFDRITADLNIVEHPDLGLILCGAIIPEDSLHFAQDYSCFNISSENSIKNFFSVRHFGIKNYEYFKEDIFYFMNGVKPAQLWVANIKSKEVKKVFDDKKINWFDIVAPLGGGKTILVNNIDRKERSNVRILDSEFRIIEKYNFPYQIDKIVFSEDKTYACLVSSTTYESEVTVSLYEM